MTRMSGIEEIAKENGDIGIFYTLTAPSKYHPYLSKPCKPNPKYGNYSPADTQKYMNKVWARIRAKLKRLGVQPYGFRVVEPHHDGTPHWHILLFAPKDDIQTITETIRHYTLQEDPYERGAQKHRATVELIDPNKGSATGYIAKYIAKNIDGKDVGEDLYGRDAVTSALRIRAWASNWKIRQFDAIGGPSVTVWREARRFANQDIAEKILSSINDETLQQIIDAADQGDWAAFVKLSGGPTVSRKEQPLRAFHVIQDKPSKYGETVKKIMGLLVSGTHKLVTRLRTWDVRPVPRVNISNNFFCSSGGANAPPLEFCQ